MSPPRTTCTPSRPITPRSGAAKRARSSRRPATTVASAATPSDSVPASARWPHSRAIFASKSGTTWPWQSGQSGHESPAPCARTKAPTTINAHAAPASAAAPRPARRAALRAASERGVISADSFPSGRQPRDGPLPPRSPARRLLAALGKFKRTGRLQPWVAPVSRTEEGRARARPRSSAPSPARSARAASAGLRASSARRETRARPNPPRVCSARSQARNGRRRSGPSYMHVRERSRPFHARAIGVRTAFCQGARRRSARCKIGRSGCVAWFWPIGGRRRRSRVGDGPLERAEADPGRLGRDRSAG